MKRHPRRLLGVALAVALASVLAACSSSDKKTTAGASAPTSSSSKITIGFSAWPGWFPWQVADEKGLFKAAGLDVSMKYFESYTDSLNALSAGKLDGNAQTLNDTISSVVGGAQEVIVLVNDNSTGNDQIIVRDGINTVQDLKGKKVAIEEGAVDHFLLLQGLTKAGMTNKDVSIQPLPTDGAAASFAAGQTDAVGAFAPFTTKALERKGSHAVFTSADFPGAIADHLVLTKAFVQKRPDDSQKLVDVWFTTMQWIKDHPDEALQIMAKKAGVSIDDYKGYDKGTTIFTLDQNIEAFTPGADMKHLDFAAKQITAFLNDTGLTKGKTPDLTGMLDARFVQARASKG
jgi:NitT/TauT family transport system substrate-binding protein